MTSKINGKTEISTPCRSETPRNTETKIGLNDYVIDHLLMCQFSWKSVQRGRLPKLVKYNPLVTVTLSDFSALCYISRMFSEPVTKKINKDTDLNR